MSYVCSWCHAKFDDAETGEAHHEETHVSPVGVNRHYGQRIANHHVLIGAKHGQRSTYVRGCRCDTCRDAEALYSREAKKRRKGSLNSTT